MPSSREQMNLRTHELFTFMEYVDEIGVIYLSQTRSTISKQSLCFVQVVEQSTDGIFGCNLAHLRNDGFAPQRGEPF